MSILISYCVFLFLFTSLAIALFISLQSVKLI